MKLTKLQRKTLQFLYLFHSKAPTVFRQMGFNWIALLPVFVIAVLGCFVISIPGFENIGWLWIGFAGGAFGRDIGRFRGIVRVWPIYKEITNWQRVSELLESNENHDA
jgi:hypothetical protein